MNLNIHKVIDLFEKLYIEKETEIGYVNISGFQVGGLKLSARFEKLGLEAPSGVHVDSDNRTFKVPSTPPAQKETPGDPGEKQGDYLSFKIINQKQKVIILYL